MKVHWFKVAGLTSDLPASYLGWYLCKDLKSPCPVRSIANLSRIPFCSPLVAVVARRLWFENIVLKLVTVLILFFFTRCQCGNCQSMWREEENICCGQEVHTAKNKNIEAVWGKLSSAGNWWKLTPSTFVLLQNITTQRFPGFHFLRFKSCCFPSTDLVNVNAV